MFLTPITLFIVGGTVLISAAGILYAPQVVSHLMLIPYRAIRQKTWYEVITSGFVHADFSHLLFNMITLLFFGPVMEQSIGAGHFIALYLSGLVASSLPSLIRHKNNPQYATLGASGAVESVLFGFILLFPMDRIYLFLIPIGIPAFIFGFLFLAYSIYASKREGSKINHEAHIAGSLWGIVYLVLFVPNTIDHIITLLGLYN
ncbi:MAG: rhomboid family intramembrane serine protease [Bacteroidota bacterium]